MITEILFIQEFETKWFVFVVVDGGQLLAPTYVFNVFGKHQWYFIPTFQQRGSPACHCALRAMYMRCNSCISTETFIAILK